MWFFKKEKIDTSFILKDIIKKYRFRRYFQLILGLLLMAISFNIFFLPNKIVSGGLPGLAIIVQNVFNLNPTSFMLFFSMVIVHAQRWSCNKEN